MKCNNAYINGGNMRICSTCNLRNKEVINLCDGRRLGFISDLEIDLDSGQVVALILPGDNKILTLGKCRQIRVLWCDIDRIGDDVILVRAKLPAAEIDCKKHK